MSAANGLLLLYSPLSRDGCGMSAGQRDAANPASAKAENNKRKGMAAEMSAGQRDAANPAEITLPANNPLPWPFT
ncbi:hypothetical protein SAMN05660226_03053 [Parapedobacter luteus]|uniref:Uncharacterized protein n=1 Tax=Parapedobacter luteus TaxID=623280 RepID=A0A1T5E0L1_9SPHI|nr:hypothetical protein [Parapedobacter luteus]SKB77296.1 hypothetical protein SAMN05660226_03053 [Parapedobacter luteus]